MTNLGASSIWALVIGSMIERMKQRLSAQIIPSAGCRFAIDADSICADY